ncbi:Uncharacterized protein dnm_004430 [Desulfonema magnum]|uniref:Uncharacterized protein n=1 Tax=Desulfonema magnum TaxID=45655 RepID=A0A975GKB4_9BACT|nr:Uncharacterized protein dnm_004430 [Desulfonema magnum]
MSWKAGKTTDAPEMSRVSGNNTIRIGKEVSGLGRRICSR